MKIPKSTTLRKYYPDSILTDDELSELERFYSIEMGISWIKPDKNKSFGVLVKYAETVKSVHG